MVSTPRHGDGEAAFKYSCHQDAKGKQAYRDRFGNPHSSAVFDHWDPRTITFMDIRPVEPDQAAEGEA